MAQDSLPLQLVTDAAEASRHISFCGYCAARPDEGDAERESRICAHCGLGVVLEARADTAPMLAEPFLVVDAALSISAVSRAAEELIEAPEAYVTGTFLGQFVAPLEVTDRLTENFFALVRRAAQRSTRPRLAAVRRAGTPHPRYLARVGWCGKPSAALVVLTAEG